MYANTAPFSSTVRDSAAMGGPRATRADLGSDGSGYFQAQPNLPGADADADVDAGAGQRYATDSVAWSLPHCPRSAATARTNAARALDAWHIGDETAASALLVISELVTNAIEHAQPPLAVHLTHEQSRGRLHVQVDDGGPAAYEAAWAASRTSDERGRGLGIIDNFTTDHGSCEHPDGATYWASLKIE